MKTPLLNNILNRLSNMNVNDAFVFLAEKIVDLELRVKALEDERRITSREGKV